MERPRQRTERSRLRPVRSACLWALALMASWVIVDPPRLILGWVLAILSWILLAVGAFLADRIMKS